MGADGEREAIHRGVDHRVVEGGCGRSEDEESASLVDCNGRIGSKRMRKFGCFLGFHRRSAGSIGIESVVTAH